MMINAINRFAQNVQMAQSRLTFGGDSKKQRPPREQTVAVYGGNSVKKGTPYYEFSEKVGEALAEAGLGVLTGGGEGAMAALTHGANRKGGYTIGVGMPFIGEEPCNACDEFEMHEDFSSRIDDGYERHAALSASVPGGVGTLMEIFKKLCEIYTDKTHFASQKQIVLFDLNGYWENLIQYLKAVPVAQGLMGKTGLGMLKIAKTIPEGIAMLKDQSVPWTKGLGIKPLSPTKHVDKVA